MAGKILQLITPENPLSLGGVEISHADIVKMIDAGIGKPTARGMAMLNERVTDLSIKMDDGRIVTLAGSIYLQRNPLTDEEKVDCAKVDTDRKASTDKRKADDANERQRALNAASDMSRQATLEALKSVGALQHINR